VRAHHEGSLVPGKLVEGHTQAYVSWGGQEHSKEEYEVLLQQDSLCWVEWYGELPASALICGHEEGNELYAVKGVVNSTDVLGKYHKKNQMAYASWGGDEKELEQFQVLCWQSG